MPVRPTLRCLREDLDLPVPPIKVRLDQLKHPLLSKTSEQFDNTTTQHERIKSIDDIVLFKAKVGRWRGAVFPVDAPKAEVRNWLVAAGVRSDGSEDDFYAALHRHKPKQHGNGTTLPTASLWLPIPIAPVCSQTRKTINDSS